MTLDFRTLLGGGQAEADPFGYGGPGRGEVIGGTLDDFFADPENLRFLADIGAGIGQGQGAGEVLGGATTGAIRRRAFQKAAAQRSQAQNDLLQQIISALGDGSLLSPKTDNAAFDSLSIDGDGGMTLKSAVAAPQPETAFSKPLSDTPLEAQRRSTDFSPFV